MKMVILNGKTVESLTTLPPVLHDSETRDLSYANGVSMLKIFSMCPCWRRCDERGRCIAILNAGPPLSHHGLSFLPCVRTGRSFSYLTIQYTGSHGGQAAVNFCHCSSELDRYDHRRRREMWCSYVHQRLRSWWLLHGNWSGMFFFSIGICLPSMYTHSITGLVLRHLCVRHVGLRTRNRCERREPHTRAKCQR